MFHHGVADHQANASGTGINLNSKERQSSSNACPAYQTRDELVHDPDTGADKYILSFSGTASPPQQRKLRSIKAHQRGALATSMAAEELSPAPIGTSRAPAAGPRPYVPSAAA